MYRTRNLVAILLVIAVGVCLLAPAVRADQAAASVAGKIVRVNATNNTIVLQPDNENAAQVTVATDGKTVIKVDGKVAPFGDLKAGMNMIAFPATGTATEIRAYAPNPG